MAAKALSEVLHATTVACAGQAVMITGASGSGKSALGLALMGLGATLIADDRTVLTQQSGRLRASVPDALRGLIEARYVGILQAKADTDAEVVLAVDLDRAEQDRLPPRREVTYLGCTIPLLHGVSAPHFAAAILQFLKAGRSVP